MLKPFDQGPVVACGIRKISDGQFETLVRSLGLGDEQPATIIAYLCAMPQLWPIRRGIDQLILRLGRAQAMIINLLIIIGRLEGFSALWFCEARLEKTLVLTVPGEVRKFDPTDFVGKHLSAGSEEHTSELQH